MVRKIKRSQIQVVSDAARSATGGSMCVVGANCLLRRKAADV